MFDTVLHEATGMFVQILREKGIGDEISTIDPETQGKESCY
jgi:hypothetical protein